MSLATLDSICTRISSGGTPSRKHPEYYAENGVGHLWVKSKELLDGVIQDTEEKISDLGLKKSSAKYYPVNTVLVAMYGANVGQLGWLRAPATVNQAICGLVVDDEKADWRFVFYSLLKNRDDLTVQAQGAAQQNLNQDLIRQFSIPLLSLEQQRKASEILSAYDDLIENCQRRIRILETMARELYREWFVEFRFPGHESVRRVASPLGEIPEGWEVKRLGDIAQVLRGRSYRTVDLSEEGGLPFLNLKCVERDGGFRRSGIKRYIGEHKEHHTARQGDILVAVTDMTQERRLVARAALVSSLDNDFGVFSMDLVKVEPKATFSKPFLYGFLRFSGFADEVKQHANGANVLHLAPDRITDYQLAVPPVALRERFSNILAPLLLQVDTLQNQEENLRKNRDLLLPRLLSGEASLPIAESPTSNVIPFPVKAKEKPKKGAPDEFKEAVLIAELVRRFSKPEFPLGRKRYNKLAYAAHRKVEDDVAQRYRKQAAGPYSPWSKYAGPEKIAQSKGYIRYTETGKLQGFLPGDNISAIDQYIERYEVCQAVAWVDENFRFKKNDDLELLTTVDFAALELQGDGKPVTVETVRHLIATNKEWAPKLKREVFSDKGISEALAELGKLFPASQFNSI